MKKQFTLGLMFLGLVSFGQHTDTDTVAVNPELDNSSVALYAPNAFSPDGDFLNDTWQVYMDGIDPNHFHIVIFDRTGRTVWESRDIESAWDGSYLGDGVTEGIYPWVIEAKMENSDRMIQYNGYTTIVR